MEQKSIRKSKLLPLLQLSSESIVHQRYSADKSNTNTNTHADVINTTNNMVWEIYLTQLNSSLLMLMHSEGPKLHRVLALLSAKALSSDHNVTHASQAQSTPPPTPSLTNTHHTHCPPVKLSINSTRNMCLLFYYQAHCYCPPVKLSINSTRNMCLLFYYQAHC